MFGSAKSSVTSFIARCWQGVCVHTALGWPEDSSACHGVASLCIPLYYVLSGLRQTSLRSVTHKSTMTRFRASLLVFSSELEIVCPHVRIKSQKLGCWPYGRGVRRGRSSWVDEDEEVKLPVNTETWSLILIKGWWLDRVKLNQQRPDWRKSLFTSQLHRLQTFV